MTAEALLELTPAAAAKVIELRGDDPARSFLRVYVAGGGCCGVQYGMAFVEDVEADDELVEAHGVRLAVDPRSRPSVAGVEIDYVETARGTGFTVKNPAAAGGSCACGGH